MTRCKPVETVDDDAVTWAPKRPLRMWESRDERLRKYARRNGLSMSQALTATARCTVCGTAYPLAEYAHAAPWCQHADRVCKLCRDDLA